jgi:AraC family transcriptional regulator
MHRNDEYLSGSRSSRTKRTSIDGDFVTTNGSSYFSKPILRTTLTQLTSPTYLGGSICRAIDEPEFRQIEVDYPSPRHCCRHAHDRAFLSLLLSGNYSEEIGRTTLVHTPGQVVFHPPDTVHSDHIGGRGARFFIIEISQAALVELGTGAPLLSQPIAISPKINWLTNLLYNSFDDATSSGLFVESIVSDIVWSLQHPNTGWRCHLAWMKGVVEILHREFAGRISLKEIAQRVQLHPGYLSRRFRDIHHQSIGQYLNRLRLSFVARRLLNPNLRLSDIAADSGFADQSHMTRLFRKHLGLTPAAYRATRLNSNSVGTSCAE